MSSFISTQKIEELSVKAKEVHQLQDQLDEQRHIADKLSKSEMLIEKYKKKLEESSDIRKQMKQLEEQVETLIEKNFKLEEEYHRASAFKPLMDSYKEQVITLESKLKTWTMEKGKDEDDTRKLRDRIGTLEHENGRMEDVICALEERLKEMELTGISLFSLCALCEQRLNLSSGNAGGVSLRTMEDDLDVANVTKLFVPSF
jgi:protein HOOK3